MIPPIKIQGIKTKLVPLIAKHMRLDADTQWIEPFMGSGVVGFNLAPKRAIFNDLNLHLIAFYEAIQKQTITTEIARKYLESEGEKLKIGDDSYYYEVRDRFNKEHDPLDFLFLNRSGFNGMIRFNRDGHFNVPYGHKPERFAKAYITKIVHQIEHVADRILHSDWKFYHLSFDEVIAMADKQSFIYCFIGLSALSDNWN